MIMMKVPETRLPLVAVLVLALSSAVVADAPASGLSGRWAGAIRIPGAQLEIQLEWSEKDGSWSGTIDIPAQGARGLPLTVIRVEGVAVEFAIAGVPGEPTFEGSLEVDRLHGTFRQAGQSFPFDLERAESSAATGESTPAPPPLGEPVALETESGTLHGSLLLPDGPGPQGH